jgi:hypothetical protein
MERGGDTIWPKHSEAEKRRMRARLLYDFEVECREQGWRDLAFVYDEEKDLFRFTDGRIMRGLEAQRPEAWMGSEQCAFYLGMTPRDFKRVARTCPGATSPIRSSSTRKA